MFSYRTPLSELFDRVKHSSPREAAREIAYHAGHCTDRAIELLDDLARASLVHAYHGDSRARIPLAEIRREMGIS